MGAILFTLIKETTLTMLGRVAWSTIFERFYTRLVVTGLEKLESMSTNDLERDTVHDVLVSLQGKKLKVIEDVLSNK